MNELRASVVAATAIVQWFPNLKSGQGPRGQARNLDRIVGRNNQRLILAKDRTANNSHRRQ